MVTPPVANPLPGIHLRHFGGPADEDLWLEIRRQAFARQRVGVRDWTREDFRREFYDKRWWRPEAMWFAEIADRLLLPAHAVGTLTLASRGPEGHSVPVLHWLAVLPKYRGRGVGRLLVNTLEAGCWAAGQHEIFLETHVGWTEAGQFYRALGYEPAGEPNADT